MSKIAPDVAVKVMQALDWISQGRTPTDACRMVCLSTFQFKQALRDPLFEALAVDAMERGADALADILLNIDSDAVYGDTDVKVMKIKSDNIKWWLSKRFNQQYGEKIVVENTFTADKAITEALARGKERAMKAIAGTVTEQAARQIVDDVAYEVVDASPSQPLDLSQFT